MLLAMTDFGLGGTFRQIRSVGFGENPPSTVQFATKCVGATLAVALNVSIMENEIRLLSRSVLHRLIQTL